MEEKNFRVGKTIKIVSVTYLPLHVKVSFKLTESGRLVEYCRVDTANHKKVCRKKLRIPDDIYEYMRGVADNELAQDEWHHE